MRVLVFSATTEPSARVTVRSCPTMVEYTSLCGLDSNQAAPITPRHSVAAAIQSFGDCLRPVHRRVARASVAIFSSRLISESRSSERHVLLNSSKARRWRESLRSQFSNSARSAALSVPLSSRQVHVAASSSICACDFSLTTRFIRFSRPRVSRAPLAPVHLRRRVPAADFGTVTAPWSHASRSCCAPSQAHQQSLRGTAGRLCAK